MRIIGHRGARNLWPENSLGGFARAISLGVDAVELDLHLSGDGEVVVIHDAFVDRTTNGQGSVSAFPLERLQELRLRDSINETVPTLAETLDLFAGVSVSLELEMKIDARGLPYAGLIAKTAALVESRGMADRVRMTCFVPEVLEEMRAVAPRYPRLASLDRRSAEMFGGVERAMRRFIDLDCTIAVERTLLELELERCRAMTQKGRLGVWVPNTPAELDFWLNQPVDQLTSDRPDIALALRARLTSATQQGGW